MRIRAFILWHLSGKKKVAKLQLTKKQDLAANMKAHSEWAWHYYDCDSHHPDDPNW